MSEQDYILATNLTKLRTAMVLLQDTNWDEGSSLEVLCAGARKILASLIDDQEKKFEQEMDG